MTTGKVFRALAGLIVLVILVVMVNGWCDRLPKAAQDAAAGDATATVTAATDTARRRQPRVRRSSCLSTG